MVEVVSIPFKFYFVYDRFLFWQNVNVVNKTKADGFFSDQICTAMLLPDQNMIPS